MMEPARPAIDIESELDRYRKRLLDLSSRNRLLSYKPTKSKTIQIIDELPEQIFNHLVIDQRSFGFQAVPKSNLHGAPTATDLDLPEDPGASGRRQPRHIDDILQTNLHEDRYEHVLTSMYRESRSVIEETGVNHLHLAIGFLEWSDPRERDRSHLAPLVLIPCELEKQFDIRRSRYMFRLSYTGEDIQSNASLQQKLRHDFGFELPEITEELQIEDYLEGVRHATREEEAWAVRRHAVLGFFSFSKIYLYDDIDPKNWPEKSITRNPLIRLIFEGGDANSDHGVFAKDYDLDRLDGADDLPLVVDADSSQQSALIDISREQNIVIEGPPGTGKSQTITNILSIAISRGWNVLFLSEKMAALEVVKANLKKVGLDQLCLPLHSDLGKPAAVYESLRQRLDFDVQHPNSPSHESYRLQDRRRRLLAYREALTTKCGPRQEPVYEVFWQVAAMRSNGAQPIYGASVDHDIDQNEFDTRLRVFDRLGESLIALGHPKDSPWLGYHASRYFASNEEVVRSALEVLREAASTVEKAAAKFREDTAQPTFWSIAELYDVDPTEFTKMPLPKEGVSSSIARGLLTPSALETARSLLTSLEEHCAARDSLERRWTVALEEAIETTASCADAIRQIPAELDNRRALDVIGVTGAMSALRSALEQIHEHAEKLGSFGRRVRTIRECRTLLDLINLVRDPTVETTQILNDKYFLPGTRRLVEQAHTESNRLKDEFDELGSIVVIEDAPDNDALADLRQKLRRHTGSWMKLFNGEYRQARRTIKGFLRHVPRWSDESVAATLERLEAARNSTRSFSARPEFVNGLPGSFNGIDTDWGRINRMLDWARAASAAGLSASSARDLRMALLKHESLGWLDELEQSIRVVHDGLTVDEHLAHLGLSVPELLDLPLVELTQKLDQACAGLNALNEIRCRLRNDNPHVADLRNALQEAIAYTQHRDSISGSRPFRELCGRDFRGADTDPSLLHRTMTWYTNLDVLHLPRELLDWLCTEEINDKARQLYISLNHLIPAIESWSEGWQKLDHFGTIDTAWLFDRQHYDSLSSRLRALASRVAELVSWGGYCRRVDEAESLGLSVFIERIADGTVTAEQARASYELMLLDAVATDAIERDSVLHRFERTEHEAIRQEFARFDLALLELNQRIVAAQACRREPPSGCSTGRVKDYTELSLIKHEVQKKQRHCRIRSLMHRAGRAVQCLKPCLMMSPLAVAQYLPPGAVQFDLVVMDEASQIKPEDALGALARSRQMVVVGDSKQLPPTSFFDRMDHEDIDPDEELAIEDSESILEVGAKAVGQQRRLKWHYRSLHHSLIDFSNQRFYDNELLIFPSVTSRNGELGIKFNYVEDGVYKGQVNEAEARHVARAIATHLKTRPHESLGVGTFNLKQRARIEDELDRLCAEEPALRRARSELEERRESLFIKNLENLQGDERDVIFISYTYGPDSTSGQVFQRFGPITLQNGWRRLNVLVTRARKRVEVFSSITPQQIMAEGKSRGVAAMRDYLEFAQSGLIPDRVIRTHAEPENPFEEAVANAIADFGLQVVPQVGVAGYRIDLGILQPDSNDDFLLGVECDGAMYHSAKSVRDRDRLRETIITSRGWRIHRVWSTDWFRNQRTEEERLRRVVQEELAKL